MTELEQQEFDAVVKELNELKASRLCKRCGFDNNREVKADNAILKDYYRAALAQIPFTKEYKLLDNSISLEFIEPNRNLLAVYHTCWDYLKHDIDYYAADLLTMLTLKSVSIRKDTGMEKVFEWSAEDKLKFFKSVTYDNVESLFPEYYQQLNQLLLTAIRRTAVVFSELCKQASEEVQDENFWKGAGLD